MEQLRDLAIRLAMEEPVGDDLPMAAARALARDVDSPTLRELAGLPSGQSRDAVDLFRQAMDELGCPVLGKSAARLLLMRGAAANILAGKIDSHMRGEKFELSAIDRLLNSLVCSRNLGERIEGVRVEHRAQHGEHGT